MFIKVLEIVSLLLCIPLCLYNRFHGDGCMAFASSHNLANRLLHRADMDLAELYFTS